MGIYISYLFRRIPASLIAIFIHLAFPHLQGQVQSYDTSLVAISNYFSYYNWPLALACSNSSIIRTPAPSHNKSFLWASKVFMHTKDLIGRHGFIEQNQQGHWCDTPSAACNHNICIATLYHFKSVSIAFVDVAQAVILTH